MRSIITGSEGDSKKVRLAALLNRAERVNAGGQLKFAISESVIVKR